ncbi:MAG: glycerate kinase [Clostridia bacterium]|nr:glycerate kinase [Clostridia bacterium]
MKIVVASDSFKGSLSGEQINNIWLLLTEGERDKYEIVPLLIADGGDGTLDAIVKQKGGKIIPATVSDPLFNKIKSRYGEFGTSAVISMCECSGLTLIDEKSRNPLYTTSYGTGELIKKAIESGKKKIYITLGGSATNDGATGALTALGYKFVKKDGTVAKGIGKELGEIVSVDDSGKIDTEGVEFVILSDVTNTLLGIKGAAKTFAKQKGASDSDIEFLERSMKNYADVLAKRYGIDVNSIVGGGAAGGMGAGLSVVLNAKIVSGVEEILKIVDFDQIIKDADYVITGEGRIDGQSKDGKVVSGVVRHAKRRGVPVIAVVGSIAEGYEKMYDEGLTAVFSIVNAPSDLDGILRRSEKLYGETAKNVLRLIDSSAK